MLTSELPNQTTTRPSAPQNLFTLTELLVSVAVISLLSAMLLPVVEEARAAANTLSCTNRLRQVGLAHSQYVNANDGYVIGAVQNSSVGHWINYMFAHTDLNYQEAYRCPSLPSSALFNPYGGDGTYDLDIHASYTMNTIRAGQGLDSWGSAPISKPENSWGWTSRVHNSYTTAIRLLQVHQPSNTIFITETPESLSSIDFAMSKSQAGQYINSYLQTDHGIPIITNRTADYRRVGNHHNGKFNALMGDGRVVAIGQSKADQWVAWSE